MDPLDPLVNAMHAEGRLRVWSLVITVFGDSVEPRGGRIATGRLRTLVSRIGVEEGALRTSLSRLASDGWVASERVGRSSSYGLTSRGRAEAEIATEAIYRPAAEPRDGAWTMMLSRKRPLDAVELGGDLWLTPNARLASGGDVGVTGDLAVGANLANRIVRVDHADAARRMRADLLALGRIGKTDLLTAIAARTLLVHRWRRLVLRFPEIPDELLTPAHPLHGLRRDVGEMYNRLSPQAEKWLDADGEGFAALPAADSRVADRFRKPAA